MDHPFYILKVYFLFQQFFARIINSISACKTLFFKSQHQPCFTRPFVIRKARGRICPVIPSEIKSFMRQRDYLLKKPAKQTMNCTGVPIAGFVIPWLTKFNLRGGTTTRNCLRRIWITQNVSDLENGQKDFSTLIIHHCTRSKLTVRR